MSKSSDVPTPGVTISPNGIKTFIPLENNPETFRDLIVRLGVSPSLGFYDIYSLDEPSLLARIPRPIHALIFIAPADVYHRRRAHDSGTKSLSYTGSGETEPIIWFQQTIGHACGLIALLHSVSNGSARQYVRPNSLLDRLLHDAVPLEPGPRAEVLYNSRELEEAHMASAMKGNTIPPSSAEPNGHHFISFVKGRDGHLYELEGGWGGPLDRGKLQEKEDMLSARALNLGVRQYLRHAEDNVEFSIVALATIPESEEIVKA